MSRKKSFSPSFDDAKEYQKHQLTTITTRSSTICNKWIIVVSLCVIGFSLLSVEDFRTSFFLKIVSPLQTSKEVDIDIPFYETDTTFHASNNDDDQHSRRKRAPSNVVSISRQAASGTASGEESGSTVTDETTTASDEGSADDLVTTASPVTEGSADDITTASSVTEGSADDTATATTASSFTEGSGVTIEATTESVFEQSGDETTPSEVEKTTAPLEMSGDETTAPMDFSGDETTAPTGVTTDSMFGPSGDGTTVDDVTDGTTVPETTTDDQGGGGGGTTTQQPFIDSTTTAVSSTTTSTTTITTTTVGGAGGDDGLTVPLYVAIIAGVVGVLLGIGLVFAVKAFAKWLKKRKLVTPMTTPVSSQLSMKHDGKPPDLNWAMARADALNRAMAIGQIAVLEFAIGEAKSAGLPRDNPQLMKDAETRLNQWKRTRTQLENAYQEKDMNTMDEFMDRFNELEMKDDTGCYQRCVDLKWDMKHAEINMTNGAATRSEPLLVSSMGQFEALNLQPATVAANIPYQNAARVMEEIRQEKLLQGRTHEGLRMDLREAVAARNPPAIAVAMDKFNKAEVPDSYDDLTKANKALEELEAERKDNLTEAQKKMEDASLARDQDALRESIEECRKFGLTDDELKTPEKLLRVIEKEDVLLAEIRNLTAEGDIAKLSNAIVIFKTPVVEMVDKTGDVAKAEEVLQKLQEKEKMKRTKDDVYSRLKRAMDIGDVTAMDGMIKALQSLAGTGEEIDEALLINGMSKLEACRGQVDYRKKMEAIKSAIERTIASENIPQLQELVDQMADLANDEEYTMTADDSRVLDESRTALNSLQRKAAVVAEITVVKPELTLALIPPNLNRLETAVERMTIAQKNAKEFDNVFTEEDAVLLEEARINTSVLDNKVTHMMEARERLDVAVEKREYIELKHAIRSAIQAPFIEKKELVEPRKLAVFLDPKARRMAVKKGMRARDIPMLGVALQDFKDAKVDDENLLLKGERCLDKLEKRERRRAKQERRKEKEDARRAADIARLTEVIKSAIASRDTDHLQLALEEFEESGYDEEDIPEITKAEELFDNLKIQDIRERLQDSIKRRDVTGLENAIDDADYGGFVMDVKEEYDVAKELLYHLRELNRLREAIAEMNRSLISEIHKYPTPPPEVHQVMSAVFILLGESPKKLQNWNEVQALLGKLGQNNITRRVRVCVPGDIPQPAVKRAEQYIKGLKLEQLSEVSKGAATFFAWSTCMIREHAQVVRNQTRLTDIELPDIGYPERPQTSLDYSWIEKNA